MEFVDIIKIVLAAVLGILGALGIAKVWMTNLKKEIVEALESAVSLAEEYKSSIAEDSQNGKKLSPDEIQAILGKLGNFFGELVDVFNVIKEALKKK